MSDTLLAILISIPFAALFVWSIKSVGNSVSEMFPTECRDCDFEGPLEYDGIFYGYAHLDAHRALHRAGRDLMKPIERLLDRIARKDQA